MVASVPRTGVAGTDSHSAGQQLRLANCGTAGTRTTSAAADHAFAGVSANHRRGDCDWRVSSQRRDDEHSQSASLRQPEPGCDMDAGFLGHLSEADGSGARDVAVANVGAAGGALDAGAASGNHVYPIASARSSIGNYQADFESAAGFRGSDAKIGAWRLRAAFGCAAGGAASVHGVLATAADRAADS